MSFLRNKNNIKIFLYAILLLSIAIIKISARTKEEWKSRIIYQLLTDRFARTNGDTSGCDLHNYCGGTFRGIINNLDYISGMGFNAIWISPILENTPGSYHGYHFTNLYKLNENFGTEQDFQDLVTACHERDIWVMLDVVANHVGPIGTDYGRVIPFDDASHYHDPCQIKEEDFQRNQDRVENCRLADLPDLKQENEFVRTTLLSWIKNLISAYKIDGIRIDTIPEVPKWFWKQFSEISGVFQIGEVFDGRLDYVSDYQNCCLDSVLNYPLFFTLKDVFMNGGSLYHMEQSLANISKYFHDSSVLGVFVDNHDNSRFLFSNSNIKRYRNAIAFSLLTNGIPIVYYGTEQLYSGGNDPMNREVLWGNMNRDSEMYQFVKILVDLRKSVELWNKPQVQRYADDHFYAFTRDYVLALFTNTDDIISRTITSHSFTEGSKLCNALDKNDCIFVNLGKINVTLNGEPKVYLLSMKKDKKMHIHNDSSKKNHSNAEEKLKYLK